MADKKMSKSGKGTQSQIEARALYKFMFSGLRSGVVATQQSVMLSGRYERIFFCAYNSHCDQKKRRWDGYYTWESNGRYRAWVNRKADINGGSFNGGRLSVDTLLF